MRQENEVQLIRRELSSERSKGFLAGCASDLRKLAGDADLRRTGLRVGQVPADADVLGRARTWLTTRTD